MQKVKDITGQKFGKLTALKYIGEKSKSGDYLWECLCECGKLVVVVGTYLRNGHTKSCGCLRITRLKTHGLTNTPEYRTWGLMKSRCSNKNDKRYKDYGGRGITVCKEWLKFENFYKDMGERPKRPKGTSIDRMNNNLGYYKENCRWANNFQQARNTRRNRMITYKGETKCMAEWAQELGINLHTLSNRINTCGWSIKKSFTTSISGKAFIFYSK